MVTSVHDFHGIKTLCSDIGLVFAHSFWKTELDTVPTVQFALFTFCLFLGDLAESEHVMAVALAVLVCQVRGVGFYDVRGLGPSRGEDVFCTRLPYHDPFNKAIILQYTGSGNKTYNLKLAYDRFSVILE